ncbi:MAG: hypothetical protein JXQ84_01460 [Rhodospirillaceae bacterium]|nr:hypothetical protein [Rhodospirillaceae bacterium]
MPVSRGKPLSEHDSGLTVGRYTFPDSPAVFSKFRMAKYTNFSVSCIAALNAMANGW